eukprot:TRINITY_DN48460_c0_g1_i1.p1 TRINITY_DN48460_c0_g1~~TRINITY_DN48460_c0_g1_i1.p1  ORF type:complete len:749 (-),score=127.24 TRINITY_DN48460_c0_g1_i1:130-2325(-)
METMDSPNDKADTKPTESATILGLVKQQEEELGKDSPTGKDNKKYMELAVILDLVKQQEQELRKQQDMLQSVTSEDRSRRQGGPEPEPSPLDLYKISSPSSDTVGPLRWPNLRTPSFEDASPWGDSEASFSLSVSTVSPEQDAVVAQLLARCAALENEGFLLRERLCELEGSAEGDANGEHMANKTGRSNTAELRSELEAMGVEATQARERQAMEIHELRTELMEATAAAKAASATVQKSEQVGEPIDGVIRRRSAGTLDVVLKSPGQLHLHPEQQPFSLPSTQQKLPPAPHPISPGFATRGGEDMSQSPPAKAAFPNASGDRASPTPTSFEGGDVGVGRGQDLRGSAPLPSKVGSAPPFLVDPYPAPAAAKQIPVGRPTEERRLVLDEPERLAGLKQIAGMSVEPRAVGFALGPGTGGPSVRQRSTPPLGERALQADSVLLSVPSPHLPKASSNSPRKHQAMFTSGFVLCPQGHAMRVLTSLVPSRWICDRCELDSQENIGALRYRCSGGCDFDLCAPCHALVNSRGTSAGGNSFASSCGYGSPSMGGCRGPLDVGVQAKSPARGHSPYPQQNPEVCCPRGHALEKTDIDVGVSGQATPCSLRRTPGTRWICDNCQIERLISPEVSCFCCAVCDFDLCKGCYTLKNLELKYQQQVTAAKCRGVAKQSTPTQEHVSSPSITVMEASLARTAFRAATGASAPGAVPPAFTTLPILGSGALTPPARVSPRPAS